MDFNYKTTLTAILLRGVLWVLGFVAAKAGWTSEQEHQYADAIAAALVSLILWGGAMLWAWLHHTSFFAKAKSIVDSNAAAAGRPSPFAGIGKTLSLVCVFCAGYGVLLIGGAAAAGGLTGCSGIRQLLTHEPATQPLTIEQKADAALDTYNAILPQVTKAIASGKFTANEVQAIEEIRSACKRAIDDAWTAGHAGDTVGGQFLLSQALADIDNLNRWLTLSASRKQPATHPAAAVPIDPRLTL